MISSASSSGLVRSPRLDLQLKCSASITFDEGAEVFPFRLKMKNYEELRPTNFLVPRILVVVRIPEEVEEWVQQTNDVLALRHCSYWLSLRGRGESENRSNVTVQIPVEQRFTVEALQEMMNRVSTGEHP